jgi:hypothetical protein
MVRHSPVACQHCQHPSDEVAGSVKERGPVHDLPVMRLRVWAAFQKRSRPRCSTGRTCKRWRYICIRDNWCRWRVPAKSSRRCAAAISRKERGSRWEQEASGRLAAKVEKIADWLSVGRLQHGDETGVRIGGKLRLPACELHGLADAFGLASEARQASDGRDRHLAALWGTGDA